MNPEPLFPAITSDVASRYLETGRSFSNDVEKHLKAIFAKGKNPVKMWNSVTGELIDSKEAWDRMVATKRPKAGEDFSASLQTEDVKEWTKE